MNKHFPVEKLSWYHFEIQYLEKNMEMVGGRRLHKLLNKQNPHTLKGGLRYLMALVQEALMLHILDRLREWL